MFKISDITFVKVAASARRRRSADDATQADYTATVEAPEGEDAAATFDGNIGSHFRHILKFIH